MDRVHDLARNDPGLVNPLASGYTEGVLTEGLSSLLDVPSVQGVFLLTTDLLDQLCGKTILATTENFNEEAYLSAN